MPPWEKYKEKPWEKRVQGNRDLANKGLEQGLTYNVSPETIDVVTPDLNPQDMDMLEYTNWLNASNGTNHTPEMAQANLEYEYGKDATPQVANAMNKKALKWYGKTDPSEFFAKMDENKAENKAILESFVRRTAGSLSQAPVMMGEMSQLADKYTSKIGDFFSGKVSEEKREFVKGAIEGRIKQIFFPQRMALKTYEKAEEITPEAFDALKSFGASQVEKASEIQSEHLSGESFVDLYNKGDYEKIGEDLGTMIAFELPNLATQIGLAYASGGASLGYMGVTAAGSKRAEKKEEDSLEERVIAPIATGFVEVATEKLIGTQRILDKAVAGKIKKGVLNRFKQIVVDFTSGGLSEGGATFGENVIDRLSGDEVKLTRGVLESTLVGGVMDTGVGMAPLTVGDTVRMRKQMTDEQIDASVESGEFTPETAEAVKKAPDEQATEEANRSIFEPEEIAPLEVPSQEEVSQAKEQQALDILPEGQEETSDASDIVGISREEKNIIREAQGMEQLDEASRKAQSTTLEEAKQNYTSDQTDLLTDEIISNPRSVDDVEVGAMLIREAELKTQLESLYEKRNKAEGSGDLVEATKLNQNIESVYGRLDQLTQASTLAGSEMGRALASLGMRINQDSFELVDLMNEARTTAKRPLTEKEKKSVEEMAKEIKELQERIDKQIPSEKLSDEEVAIRQKKASIKHKIFEMRQKTAWDKYTTVADFVRAMKLSFDMGYFGRQGGKALLSRPRQAIGAMRGATSTLFSEKNFYTINEKLKKDKNHAQRVSSKLEILDIDGEFDKHQEAMNSKLAEKFPWVRASNRHMITGLNLLRVGMFDSYMKKNPDASQEELRAWASFVNEYTGRGSLGSLERSAHSLTNFLLAPRWVASNWQTIASERHAFIKDKSGKKKLNKKLMKDIAKEKAKFYVAWMGMAALFKALGFDVGEDPEKSDFIKFSKGDLKIDMTAGQAQSYRLLFLAAETALASHGFTELEERGDLVKVLKNYGMYKLAPSATLPLELITKENLVGDERTVAESVVGMAVPIIIENIYQEMKDDMDMADIVTAASLEAFGVGAQIYEQD